MRFCISIAKSNAFDFMKQNQRTRILTIIDVLLLYNHRRSLILFGKNASILHNICSKLRYFLLICTKIKMVYRLIFCIFLKKFKFTLLWYPKLWYFWLVRTKITLVYRHIFSLILVNSHQIYIIMIKNDLYSTYLYPKSQ